MRVLLSFFFVAIVAFAFISCSKTKIVEAKIAVPTKCDYVLPNLVDFNASEDEILADLVLENIQMRKDIKILPCINLLDMNASN